MIDDDEYELVKAYAKARARILQRDILMTYLYEFLETRDDGLDAVRKALIRQKYWPPALGFAEDTEIWRDRLMQRDDIIARLIDDINQSA